MNDQDRHELISRLRKRVGITDDMATDEEVLEGTKGTFTRYVVELEMASERFRGVLHEEIRATRDRMHARIWRLLHWLHDL